MTVQETTRKRRGIGGHHRPVRGATCEWLTPPGIVRELGPFELDPCSPVNRPWDKPNKYAMCRCGSREPWANCCGRKAQ